MSPVLAFGGLVLGLLVGRLGLVKAFESYVMSSPKFWLVVLGGLLAGFLVVV